MKFTISWFLVWPSSCHFVSLFCRLVGGLSIPFVQCFWPFSLRFWCFWFCSWFFSWLWCFWWRSSWLYTEELLKEFEPIIENIDKPIFIGTILVLGGLLKELLLLSSDLVHELFLGHLLVANLFLHLLIEIAHLVLQVFLVFESSNSLLPIGLLLYLFILNLDIQQLDNSIGYSRSSGDLVELINCFFDLLLSLVQHKICIELLVVQTVKNCFLLALYHTFFLELLLKIFVGGHFFNFSMDN